MNGRYAVRLCVLNHTTTAADVEDVVDFFAYTGVREAGSAIPSAA